MVMSRSRGCPGAGEAKRQSHRLGITLGVPVPFLTLTRRSGQKDTKEGQPLGKHLLLGVTHLAGETFQPTTPLLQPKPCCQATGWTTAAG